MMPTLDKVLSDFESLSLEEQNLFLTSATLYMIVQATDGKIFQRDDGRMEYGDILIDKFADHVRQIWRDNHDDLRPEFELPYDA